MLIIAVAVQTTLFLASILLEGHITTYAPLTELRVLLWIVIAYMLSSNASLRVRSVIMLFAICQLWTIIVFVIYLVLNTEVVQMMQLAVFGVVASVLVGWLMFRDYPGKAPQLQDGKTYLLFKRCSKKRLLKTFLCMFGAPYQTVKIYHNGIIYGFAKNDIFKGIKSENLSEYTPVQIDFDIKSIDPNIGTRYNKTDNNCITALTPVWEQIGYKPSYMATISPAWLAIELKYFLR